MKKILAVCVLAAAPILAAENGAMNDAERALLVEQLEKSKAAFLESIANVTEAQWKFKPAPNVWSVAECSEHIIVAETYLFNASQGMLKSPAAARPETSTAEQDKKLVAAIGDRTHKAKAPEPLVPSGKFATPSDAAKEFTALRDKSLEYARATNDELRVHTTQGPLGTMDAYQILLLMAVHTGRHTDQIREVQANADYPKATAQLSR
jgi:hypothetical protein